MLAATHGLGTGRARPERCGGELAGPERPGSVLRRQHRAGAQMAAPGLSGEEEPGGDPEQAAEARSGIPGNAFRAFAQFEDHDGPDLQAGWQRDLPARFRRHPARGEWKGCPRSGGVQRRQGLQPSTTL